MAWKELTKRVFARIRRWFADTRDDADPAFPIYATIIPGSNPDPFTEGAEVRLSRAPEGPGLEVAVRPRGGKEFVPRGSLTRDQADTWSGRVEMADGHDTLVLSRTRRLGQRRRWFLYGIVIDESSPLMGQEQGTWGAEEDEGDAGTSE